MDIATKEKLAEFICGDDPEKYPIRRSSQYLSRFFHDIGLSATHDGTTRVKWVLLVLSNLNGPDLQKVILRLGSPKLYGGDAAAIRKALKTLNEILAIESLKVIIEGVEPRLTRITPNFNFEAAPEEERELVPLPPPDFDKLNFEAGVSKLLKDRWQETQVCIDAEACLSAVIMMGSMLEGFLLGIILKYPKLATTAKSAPRRDEKVKPIQEWTLSHMIDVAHEVGWIRLDVKRFSHALRSFRNVVHPYEQLATGADPDLDTCKISWLVVQAACNHIAKWISVHQSQ